LSFTVSQEVSLVIQVGVGVSLVTVVVHSGVSVIVFSCIGAFTFCLNSSVVPHCKSAVIHSQIFFIQASCIPLNSSAVTDVVILFTAF
jgi:hypothetical protein